MKRRMKLRSHLGTAAVLLAASMLLVAAAAGAAFAQPGDAGMRIYTIYIPGNSVSFGAGGESDTSGSTETGDAVLLESGGQYLLMDCGRAPKDPDNNYLANYLKAVGATELDVYLSHLHSDHIDGLEALLRDPELTIGKIYVPDPSLAPDWTSDEGTGSQTERTRSIISMAQAIYEQRSQGSALEFVFLGPADMPDDAVVTSEFAVGSVTARVIGPVNQHKPSYYEGFMPEIRDSLMSHYLNNRSLVTMFTSNSGVKYLTAGDIEEAEQAALVAKYGSALKADIYKMPHHGLVTSVGESFTKAVHPTWSICQNAIMDSVNAEKAYPCYYAMKEVQKYGFCYVVGEETPGYKPSEASDNGAWHSLITDVDASGNVALYKDANESGTGESAERLQGRVETLGLTQDGNTPYQKKDDKGNIETGYRYDDPDVYFLGSDSRPITGIYKPGDGNCYYLGTGGCMHRGYWKMDDAAGKRYSGWHGYGATESDEPYRYYEENGNMLQGISSEKLRGRDGEYYYFYFDDQGLRTSPTSYSMKANSGSKFGLINIGGKNYAVSENGAVYNYKGASLALMPCLNGGYCGFGADGGQVAGFQEYKDKGYWMYFDGATGVCLYATDTADGNADWDVVTIGDYKYAVHTSGKVFNRQGAEIALLPFGKGYRAFNKTSGVMLTGFQKCKANDGSSLYRYFAKSTGISVYAYDKNDGNADWDIKTIGSYKYAVHTSGKVYNRGGSSVALLKFGKAYVMCNKTSGNLCTGFQKYNGMWRYYAKSTGKSLYASSTADGNKDWDVKTIGSCKYAIHTSGKVYNRGGTATAVIQFGKGYRIFNKSSGAMLTGFHKYKGTWRYFAKSNGVSLYASNTKDGNKYYDVKKIGSKKYIIHTSGKVFNYGGKATAKIKFGKKTYKVNTKGVVVG